MKKILTLCFVVAMVFLSGQSVGALDKDGFLEVGDVVKSEKGSALYTINKDYKLLPWLQGWHGKTWYSNSKSSAGNYSEANYPTIHNLATECF